MNLHDYDFRIPMIDPKTGLASRAFQEWTRITKDKKANKVESATSGNLAKLTSDGDIEDAESSLSDISTSIDAPFAELDSSKILAYDSVTGILQNIDLYDWITAGSRMTVTDDGDGTVTIAADDQSIDVNDYISGTANEITVIDNGDSTATIEGAGDDTDFTVLTAIQAGGGGALGIQYKTRALTLNGGIITTVGAESGWNDI